MKDSDQLDLQALVEQGENCTEVEAILEGQDPPDPKVEANKKKWLAELNAIRAGTSAPQGQQAQANSSLTIDNGKIIFPDLIPTAEELQCIAYASLSGDSAVPPLGRHGRKNIHHTYHVGRTKFQSFQESRNWNSDYFDLIAAKLNKDPWSFVPSLERRIPKNGGGTRPIGDPSEDKRPVGLYDRAIIGPGIEDLLMDGQVGGRPKEWLQERLKGSPLASKKGVTPQDLVAFSVQEAAHRGFRWVLVMDIISAFTLVPKRAVLPELRKFPMSKRAAEFIWRVSRLDAVRAKSGERIPYSKEMGVEQGGALSALMLNLALAPVLKTLQERLGVAVLAYLDDIYILAMQEATAHKAFHLFKSVAGQRGIRNIRPLLRPGQAADAKASKIIPVSEQEPLKVLKRYLVTPTWIGMAPVAVEYVEAEMEEQGLKKPVSLRKVKKLAGQQALTKRGVRFTSDLLSPWSPGTGIPSHSGEDPQQVSFSTSGPKGEGSPRGWKLPEGEGDHGGLMYDPPAQQVSLVNGIDLEQQEDYQEDGSGYGREGVGCPPPVGQASLVSSPSLSPGQGHRLTSAGRGPASPRRSRMAKVQGTAATSGNSGPAAGASAGVGESGPARKAPRALPLRVRDQAVADILRKRKPLHLGAKYKDTDEVPVCDLRGLSQVLGPSAKEHDFRLAINNCLKAARARRLVQAVVDRRDAWTAIPDILGNIDDKTYRKLQEERIGDGGWAMTLRKGQARKGSRRPVSPSGPPPQADVVVYQVRRSRVQVGVWKAKVREGKGRPRWLSFPGDTVSAGGAASVVAKILEKHPGRTAAVAALPELVGLVVPRELGRELDRPAFVPLCAQRQLEN